MTRAIAVVVALGLAGCAWMGGPLPPLEFPQFQQTRQTFEGGIGKRYEDYNACRKTTADVPSIIACMDAAGYDYIARSTEEQAAECWRLRDPQANWDGRLPDVWCFFRRTDATPPAP